MVGGNNDNDDEQGIQDNIKIDQDKLDKVMKENPPTQGRAFEIFSQMIVEQIEISLAEGDEMRDEKSELQTQI